MAGKKGEIRDVEGKMVSGEMWWTGFLDESGRGRAQI